MSESHQVNGTSRGEVSSVAIGFLLGTVVGAGIALLLAPETGKETRLRIADAGRRWGRGARDLARDLKQEAKSALEAAREELKPEQRAYEKPPGSTVEPSN